MIIIYILAAIGGICVLGAVGMAIMIIAMPPTNEDEMRNICTLLDERCIHEERESCAGCPVAENENSIDRGETHK